MIQESNRRGFFKTAAAAGGLSILGTARKPAFAASVQGANSDVRVAVVGLRSKGRHHIKMLQELKGVRLAAICDADETIIGEVVKELAKANIKVETYTDVRKLLENKNIDAITTATPNHWHSLITVWGCQAGKDVYVEKPISHNVWEGRKAVEAAQKYNRIVQAGTQSRSDEGLLELAAYLKRGELGKVLRARGFCYKRRASIGKVSGPQPIPAGVHYDLWCGPSPLVPLRRKELHYDWHWVWATGCGDIGNQGIHEMDMCRWMLGQEQLPPRVLSIGGRFGYDDDGQTPNTQIAVLGYEPAPIIFEVRGLPTKSGTENMDNYRGVRVGMAIECENGYFAGGGGGGWVYDNNHKKVKQFTGSGGDKHMENFIQAVRSRKSADLKAGILGGHISSALCHLANISHRLGTQYPQAEIQGRIGSRADVAETLGRFAEHLTANGVNLAEARPYLGAALDVAREQEKFASSSEYDLGNWANRMIRRDYRPPFVVPDKV